jgi:hypothetical protein
LPEGKGFPNLPAEPGRSDAVAFDRTTVWRIAAGYGDLSQACFLARISFNGIVLETEQMGDLGRAPAYLEFPSHFCARADQFLYAAADLVMRNVTFSLALTQYEGPDRHVVAFSRVFPELDRPTLQLLREIHPSQAALVEELNARILELFERLKHQVFL